MITKRCRLLVKVGNKVKQCFLRHNSKNNCICVKKDVYYNCANNYDNIYFKNEIPTTSGYYDIYFADNLKRVLKASELNNVEPAYITIKTQTPTIDTLEPNMNISSDSVSTEVYAYPKLYCWKCDTSEWFYYVPDEIVTNETRYVEAWRGIKARTFNSAYDGFESGKFLELLDDLTESGYSFSRSPADDIEEMIT